jgi:hypothetical protein
MADAPALGAGAPKGACRFESDLAYQSRGVKLRFLVGVLFALPVAACVDPFGNMPDGVQIDGIVVGPQVDCGVTSCTRVVDCAAMEEFRTETPAGVAATQVYEAPIRTRDGTGITSGAAIRIVVFDMQDGSKRAVSVMVAPFQPSCSS